METTCCETFGVCNSIMEPPTSLSKIDTEPNIATWELWVVAQTLITARGDDAEAHAEAKLAEAKSQGDEAEQLVWSGVATQLKNIRGASGLTSN